MLPPQIFLGFLILQFWNNAVDNSHNRLYRIRLFKIEILYILNVMHIKIPLWVYCAGDIIVSLCCRPSSIGMIVWFPISELDILTFLSILALRVTGDALLSLLGDLCVYLRPLLDSRSNAPLAVLIYEFLLLSRSLLCLSLVSIFSAFKTVRLPYFPY